MVQNSTSVEMLTAGKEEISENEDPEKRTLHNEPTVDGGFISTFLNKHKHTVNIVNNIITHIVLVIYFAFATKYFIDQGAENIDFCDGYGMLILVFCVIYILIFYSFVYKPYISKIVNRILEPIEDRLVKLYDRNLVKWVQYAVIFILVLIFLIVDSWDSPNRLIALGGFFVMLLFGYVFSKHPKQIKSRPIVCGCFVQFALGLFTIRWEVGRNIFKCAGDKVTAFLKYTDVGSKFVYGDFLINNNIFAFEAMSVIFFLSFMVHILYYYGIVQKIVVALGLILQKIMGTTICESVNAAANIFLGMTESPILLQPYLQDLTLSEVHAVMAAGFAAVSGTVLAAYIAFGANATHLITASVMSAPASLCFSKLFYPETEETRSTKEKIVISKNEDGSVLDAACRGASMAIEIVLGIVANVIAFVTFVAFTNGLVGWLGVLLGQDNWSVEELLSYVFMPLSFLMGVPWEECRLVGKLIGIKTIINEFAAYQQLGILTKANMLSKRSEAIATYAVCGFSNPGSVGIMISTMSTLMPGKRRIITSLVFRSFVAGATVCFMTACIAGMLMADDDL